ncbi:helix-turn-helix domain-containing protein [Aquimarina rhabdastrellae]
MLIDKQLLFFFSALGAFNGLLLSLYFFFFIKKRQASFYYLGMLLLMLSIRIGKSVFFYFNPKLSQTFLQIGLSACFLIGPFLLLYIKTSLASNINHKKALSLHFFPWLTLILVVGFLYPYVIYPDLWCNQFFKAINYQWLFYLLWSSYLMYPIIKKGLAQRDKMLYNELWILSVFIGNIIIWAAYFTSSYTSYIVGALSFSFVLYLSILILFKRKQSFTTSHHETSLKYATNKINTVEAKELINALKLIMEEQKPYINPNIKLIDIAKSLHISPHRLSQLMNDNLQKNFSLFINEYRIEEAKRLLQLYPSYTLEAISYEAGFNSKSSFYATFKKLTGYTPAQFRNQLKKL